MTEAGRWLQGAEEIEGFLARGDLELVEPSVDQAEFLLSEAQRHLDAGEPLITVHPPSAVTLIYDGARKALAAVLARQGLRATRAGGHLVLQYAVEAQLGQARGVVRGFRDLRRRRNDVEYPSVDTLQVTEAEARGGLTDAREILERMQQFLPNVGPFR